MFVTGTIPSAGVNWLALSRDAKPGGPPTTPPAWALPCSGSFWAPPLLKLNAWPLNAFSVKPRTYDQSCDRLCIAWRFARAASMSFACGDVNDAGLQRDVNHWFVHG